MTRLVALAILALLGPPKPRVVRTDVFPQYTTDIRIGERRQLCGFVVTSDSARALSGAQVGIPLCDSLARIYTRAPRTKR